MEVEINIENNNKSNICWDVTPCSIINDYRFCLHLQGRTVSRASKRQERYGLLKVATVLPSETSLNVYLTSRCHIPEDINFYNCLRENLKPLTITPWS
jgi:hypothetical protein